MEQNNTTDKGFLMSQSAWDKLPLSQKAEMIKVAVKNGIYDLDTIRKEYNSLAESEKPSDDSYYSTMEKVAEENYKKWGFNTPDEALTHALNDNTYNYKGYYAKYPASKANADTHWTDEFKTVYHPTFSDESIYSGNVSEYNPQGLTGGHWEGETFIPAGWQQQHADGGPLVKDANLYGGGGFKDLLNYYRGQITDVKDRVKESLNKRYNATMRPLVTNSPFLKPQKVIKTNTGEISYYRPKHSGAFWKRNGKRMTEDEVARYKLYDRNLGANRRLARSIMDYSLTPIDTPYIDWLSKKSQSQGNARWAEDKAQTIPVGGKYITLRTKGNLNLTDVPITFLNDIAYNTGISNTNIKNNLGLVGLESTFGGYSKALGNSWREGETYPKHALTNNHAWMDSPESDYLSALHRRYDFNKGEQVLEAEKNAKYAIEHGLINEGATPHYYDDMLADSFARYANAPNKYNPGNPNYSSVVTSLGNEAWGDTSIQDWWNTEGKAEYQRGLNDRNKKAYGGSLIEDTNIYTKGGKKKTNASGKQAFLNTLDQSLQEDGRFNSPEWRRYFTELANVESGYSPNITNSIGAKGYFQLMPSNRSKNWTTPTQQFHEFYKFAGNNLDYLNKHLTKKDWERAKALGIDIFGLMAGAHLGGVGGVVRALRGQGNAKDSNGTSVMSYMTRFSQSGKGSPYLGSNFSSVPVVRDVSPMSTFTPEQYNLIYGDPFANNSPLFPFESPTITPYVAPDYSNLFSEVTPSTVDTSVADTYSKEQLAKEERANRLNALNLVLGNRLFGNPSDSSNGFFDFVLGDIASNPLMLVSSIYSDNNTFADGGPKKVYSTDNYPLQIDPETGNIVDRETGDYGSIMLDDVVVTPESKTEKWSPYSWGSVVPFEYSRNSYYRPEDALEAFNTITFGGLNNFSPTQWARRAYDLGDLWGGNMSKKEYWDRWINGNEGLVSKNFNNNHPYWSMAFNGIGDAVGTSLPNILNNTSKAFKYLRLNKTYGGVPHKKIEGTLDYMDEMFPYTHNKHTVWTTNDYDYAHSGYWSSELTNPVFDVYTDPKALKVLDTPAVPDGHMLWWGKLPYKIENGKVMYRDNVHDFPVEGVARSKEISLKRNKGYNPNYSDEEKGVYIISGKSGHINDAPTIKTDNVVKYSKNKNYDATQFHSVFDGGATINNVAQYYPIDELVLNPGAEKFVLPHETSKYKLWDQLPDRYFNLLPESKYVPLFNLIKKNNND